MTTTGEDLWTYFYYMFSKVEASQLRTAFWTAFGRYMAPVEGAEEDIKVNWINYKTGEKDIFFRLKTESDETSIAIELAHKDDQQRKICFDQFVALKKILHQSMGEEWNWEADVVQEGKKISRISKALPRATIYKKEDWPLIISFLKQRIIALDLFWSNAKYSFEQLR